MPLPAAVPGPLRLDLPAPLLAQATTSTTRPSDQAIPGEPLPQWVVVGSGGLLLVAIIVGGLVLRGRARGQRPERGDLDPTR